jgi:hypothetical protein
MVNMIDVQIHILIVNPQDIPYVQRRGIIAGQGVVVVIGALLGAMSL